MDRYWEIYDDQSEKDFDTLEYRDLRGKIITEPITGSLARQAAGIRRRNGRATEIKVYKREAALV